MTKKKKQKRDSSDLIVIHASRNAGSYFVRLGCPMMVFIPWALCYTLSAGEIESPGLYIALVVGLAVLVGLMYWLTMDQTRYEIYTWKIELHNRT